MATLVIGAEEAVVVLRRSEQAVCFHRNLHLPLTSIVHVRVPSSPWMELRGWRSTGVALPGSRCPGVRRHGSGWDFTAVDKRGSAVLIELNAGRYRQVMVSVADPEATANALAAAAGIAR